MKKILAISLIVAMCGILLSVASERPPQKGEPPGISKTIEDLSQAVTLTVEFGYNSYAPMCFLQDRPLGYPHKNLQEMQYAIALNTEYQNKQLPGSDCFNLRC